MGIFDKQYSKIITEELIRYLVDGKVPDSNTIQQRISKVLNSEGGITYQYFPQPSRSVFQIQQYNDALKQIKFDIDLFQEELLDLFGESVKRVNFAELYYKIHSHELKNLKSKLESILFSIQNADYYFSGSFDNFSDTTKTDLEKSTPSIVDLREGALVLPFGGRNTARISMTHLASYDNWKIETNVPESSIVRQGQLNGTKFYDMFTDVKAAWAYEVVTTEKIPVSIRFLIPIAGAPEQEAEIFLNRLELTPHSLGSQNIVVKLSNDNVNYFTPLGYEAGITVKDYSVVYAMDFETSLVQYVELTFTKNSPDDLVPDPRSGQDVYQYVFGLSHFAAFTTGRLQRATYYSKPFRFDSENTISKIALSSNFFRPPGTTIKYQVALVDDQNNFKSNFIPINPLGSQTTAGASEVVEFSDSNYKTEKFVIGYNNTANDLQYGSITRGRRLFKLKENVNPAPIFGSIELYRGYNSWARDTSTLFSTLSVPDCYVNFSTVDTERLYFLKTEAPANVTIVDRQPYVQYTSPTQAPGSSYPQVLYDTKVILPSSPYYVSSNGHSLRPSLSLQGGVDPAPNYSIYSIKKISGGERRRISVSYFPGVYPNGGTAASTGNVTFNLGISDFVINSPDSSKNPALFAVATIGPSSSTLLTPGLDYEIETTLIDNVAKPTGRVHIKHHPNSRLRPTAVTQPSSNPTVQGFSLYLEYVPEEDVTHRILSLNDKEIILRTVPRQEDVYQITYRVAIESPNEIIRNSVKVYDKPLSDVSTRLLTEGTDYSLDAISGTIRRINTGTVPSAGGVHVTYDIKFSGNDIQRFSTWCKIENPDGIDIKFLLDLATKKSSLNVDYSKGEKLFLSTQSNLLEITDAVSIPRMAPGWVQFIVFSKNPKTYTSMGTNLIDQVIQLLDENKQRVFREQSRYFSTILAYREPMIQRTLNHLRVNVLAEDTKSFAIDDTNRDNPVIVVNYVPNNTTDLYAYIPNPSLTLTSYSLNFGGGTSQSVYSTSPLKSSEVYSLKWYYFNAEEEGNNNNVVIRIDLEQDSNTDGSVTPKVFDYQLRVGF